MLLLGCLLNILAPAPPRLQPQPPQTVQTAHPLLCVHSRLTDEVEDWKIQKTYQLIREMGASTIVELFPWAYIEGSEGAFDWHHPDRLIELARREGLQVIARLGIVPAWARPDARQQPTTLNYLAADRFDEYARFVGAFAARYRDQVHLIIPWNEPNLMFEWGDRQVAPEEYVRFLRAVYEAAHAANPAVIVLGGALAPTLEPESSAIAMNELDFLRRVYEAGGGKYFDALAVHTYGFVQPPSAEPAPDRLNWRRFELLLAVMRRYSDVDKPVYITESGWNDHPRWTNAVSPGARIQYTVEALKLVEREHPQIRNLCLWYFRSPFLTRSYPDYYALVTPEFRHRPIYDALRDYARGELP